MDLFNLPYTAKVNRVIPKSAFDSYTTAKQKKLFTDLITRITWLFKISKDTVNLEGKDILEIQIFRIDLKLKQEIQQVLEIIDKSIPYNIVFVISYENLIYLSTSSKHPHPVNVDKSVIDWTFKTDWFTSSENKYTFRLKSNIDSIYQDFCIQLSGDFSLANKPLGYIIDYKKKVDELEKDILRLKTSIVNSNQFKTKIELNIRLKERQNELKSLIEFPGHSTS